MKLFKDLFTKVFKNTDKNRPWLDYYSEKDRTIKFTDKAIYEYLKDCIGED